MGGMTLRVALAVVGVGLMAGQGRAGLVSYIGEDLQLTSEPTTRTNSDAAAAAFRAAASALAPLATITFESSPLGAFTNLAVAPGVSLTGTDYTGGAQTIRDTSGFPAYPSVDGSNTTAGGTRFVEVTGGIITFTFDRPTQFFGAYLTGVQTSFFLDSVTFSDGTSQSIALAGVGTSGTVAEIAFLGFIDAGRFITGVTVNAGLPNSSSTSQDFIGVDDVTFQAVPEPPSLLLCTIAGLASAAIARARRRPDPA